MSTKETEACRRADTLGKRSTAEILLFTQTCATDGGGQMNLLLLWLLVLVSEWRKAGWASHSGLFVQGKQESLAPTFSFFFFSLFFLFFVFWFFLVSRIELTTLCLARKVPCCWAISLAHSPHFNPIPCLSAFHPHYPSARHKLTGWLPQEFSVSSQQNVQILGDCADFLWT